MTTLVRPFDFLLDHGAGWRTRSGEEPGATVAIAGGELRLRSKPISGEARDSAPAALDERLLPASLAVAGDDLYVVDGVRDVVWHWRTCCGDPAVLGDLGPTGERPRRLRSPRAAVVDGRGDLVIVDTGNRRLQHFTLPDRALRRVVRVPGAESAPVDAAPLAGGGLLVAVRPAAVWRLDRQGRRDPRYDGTLPGDPERIAAGPDGLAYVSVAVGGGRRVVVLDPQGRVLAAPPAMAPAVLAWIADRVPEVRSGERPASGAELAAGRAALLPDHIRAVLPAPAARLEGREIVLTAPDPATCRNTPHPIGARVGEDGSLEVGDAAVGAIVDLLIGPAGPARLGSRLVRGGVAGEVLGQRRDGTSPDVLAGQPLPPAFLEAARLRLEAAAAADPPGDPSLPSLAGAGRWTHTPAGAVRLALLTLDGIRGDAQGRPGLPAASVAALVAAAAAEAAAGPLVQAPRPPARYEASGAFRIEPLDAERLGNRWHRVVLELDVPDRTSIQLFAFTSDVARQDVAAPAPGAAPGPWRPARLNATEWLVQSPPGRYLHLALQLNGPGDRTPAVRRIYVYAERDSSLRYLPAVYHEDDTGRETLDRLLSLTDTIVAEVESAIEDFPRNLAAAAADPEFLPWLASWFDLVFEPSWSLEQRRRILAKIIELYAARGTSAGMVHLLSLHTGLDGALPRVVEHYRGLVEAARPDPAPPADSTERGCAGGPSAAPDLAAWLGDAGPGAAHHFTVLLPAAELDTDAKQAALRRLVAGSSPAHTTFSFRPVVPGVRLGAPGVASSAIGLDSLVGEHRDWRLPDAGHVSAPDELGARLPPDPAGAQAGLRVGGRPRRACDHTRSHHPPEAREAR